MLSVYLYMQTPKNSIYKYISLHRDIYQLYFFNDMPCVLLPKTKIIKILRFYFVVSQKSPGIPGERYFTEFETADILYNV